MLAIYFSCGHFGIRSSLGRMRRSELLVRRPIIRMCMEMGLAIDAWRARQPGIPNFAEAVRRLVEIALQAEAEKC